MSNNYQKEIEYITRGYKIDFFPVDESIENVFMIAERLKGENLDFNTKVELIKELVHELVYVNRGIIGAGKTKKIKFDIETLNALCFYCYQDCDDNIVKVPLFLTNLYPEFALNLFDLSELNFRNMSLSLEMEQLPDEAKKGLKNLGELKGGTPSTYRINYFDLTKVDIISQINFDELYYGPMSQPRKKKITHCDFNGIDMSQFVSEKLTDILFLECDFSNCGLNANQIMYLHSQPYGADWFNPERRNIRFANNNLRQGGPISFLDIISTFAFDELYNFQGTGISIYFDETEFSDRYLFDGTRKLTEDEVLCVVLSKFINFLFLGVFERCYINGFLFEAPYFAAEKYNYITNFLIKIFPKFKELILNIINDPNFPLNNQIKIESRYDMLMNQVNEILSRIDDTEIRKKYKKGIPTKQSFFNMSDDERDLFDKWVNYLLDNEMMDSEKVKLGGIEDFETYKHMINDNLKLNKQ